MRRRPYYASLDAGYRTAVRLIIARQRRTIRELETENRNLRGTMTLSKKAKVNIRVAWAETFRRWGL